MNFVIAVLGLAFLVLIHEAGHFFVARAVGMRPRKFYLGFPPAVVSRTRNGIEYGIGSIPLGGYVKIPGMHRPAAADLDHHLARALYEAPWLEAAVEPLRRALHAGDLEGAAAAVAGAQTALAATKLSEPALRGAEKGLQEIADALAPDAYWRARTWKRVAVILAGPAANVLCAIVLFTGFQLAQGDTYRLGFTLKAAGAAPTSVVDTVEKGQPAETMGLRARDRVVAVDRVEVAADAIAPAIRASQGAPLSLTVERGGALVQLGPAAARHITAPGVGTALVWSVKATGEVSKEIGKTLGRLVSGKGRKDVSSVVGTVQASEQAAAQGFQSYLSVLGLISLSLALLNLLPLLPLDGGHILFSLVEGVRGRAVRREIYERVSMIGIAVVLLLFIVGLSNDVTRLSGG